MQNQLLEQSANAAAAASSSERPRKKEGKGRQQSDAKYFVYSPDDDISSSEEDNVDGGDVHDEDSDDSEPEFSEFVVSSCAFPSLHPFSCLYLSPSTYQLSSLLSYPVSLSLSFNHMPFFCLSVQSILVAKSFAVIA